MKTTGASDRSGPVGLKEMFLCVIAGVVIILAYLNLSLTVVAGTAAALTVFVLVLKRVDYGLYLGAATIPLGVLGPADAFHGTLTVTRLLFLLTAFSLLVRYLLGSRTGKIRKTAKNQALLILSLIVLLSAGTGIDFSESITGLFYYYVSFVVYVVTTLIVRDETTYRRAVLAILLPLSISLFLGTLSYQFNLDFAARFSVSDARRMTSTSFLGPNSYALMLVTIFPFAVNFYLHETARSRKALFLLWAGLIIFGTLLTYSRASTVTLILVSVYILVRSFNRLSQKETVGLVLAGVLVLLLLPGLVFQRVESLSRGGEDPSLKARWSYVLVGYEVFKDHPFLGVGPNNYKVAYASPEYRSVGYQSESNEEIGKERGRTGRAAHNMYIEAISEIGLAGIALLIYIFLLTWKEFRDAQRQFVRTGREKMWLVTNSLELGFLAFLLNSFFLSSGFFPILWIFIGLATASVAIAGDDVKTEAGQ